MVSPVHGIARSEKVDNQIKAVVLTISDRCSRGETTDSSGPAVVRFLEEKLNARIYNTEVIPDHQRTIKQRLKLYCDDHDIDLLVTAGGTGFSPHDVTPEAVRSIAERLTPGLDEAMRQASMQKTPFAVLSRGVSGMRHNTLIISLPGSEKGAVENLEAIAQVLPHGLAIMRGEPSDCGRSEPPGAPHA